jgi:putative flippase GtrA
MLQNRHVILGVRNFDLPDVPPRSRMGNKITSLVFRLLCGLHISDTQTGLRAIPREYLPALTEVSGDRYEYETNMLLQMQSLRIPYSEVSIETVYIEENQTSHFRPVRDSMRIYGLILKFISSSLIASVVDLGIFFLLSLFLPGILGVMAETVSTFIARVCSSAVNYTINKKAVFRSGASGGTSLVRYYILAAGIFIASDGAMTVITLTLGLGGGEFALLKTLLKFIIDSILFLISFRAQREWVFADRRKK